MAFFVNKSVREIRDIVKSRHKAMKAVDPSVRLCHVYDLVAQENGYRTWPAMKAALESGAFAKNAATSPLCEVDFIARDIRNIMGGMSVRSILFFGDGFFCLSGRVGAGVSGSFEDFPGLEGHLRDFVSCVRKMGVSDQDGVSGVAPSFIKTVDAGGTVETVVSAYQKSVVCAASNVWSARETDSSLSAGVVSSRPPIVSIVFDSGSVQSCLSEKKGVLDDFLRVSRADASLAGENVEWKRGVSFLIRILELGGNVLVCGATGSGKTRLQSDILAGISSSARVGILDPFSEIKFHGENALYADVLRGGRTADAGSGAVDASELMSLWNNCRVDVISTGYFPWSQISDQAGQADVGDAFSLVRAPSGSGMTSFSSFSSATSLFCGLARGLGSDAGFMIEVLGSSPRDGLERLKNLARSFCSDAPSPFLKDLLEKISGFCVVHVIRKRDGRRSLEIFIPSADG